MIGLVTLALTMGLVSNLHCLGMCGPIALALPLNRSSNTTKAVGIGAYSLGRSFGYALLGLIVGFIGMSADLLGVLQWLSIISGALIILFAWRGYYNFNIGSNVISSKVMGFMGAFLKRKEKKGNSRLLGFGFVNAFLPCGMVYLSLITAMNFGSIPYSMLFMFLFGLGTSPGFFAIALMPFSKSWFSGKKVLVASLVTVVGIAMILRGMNLDIPIISPKMQTVQSADDGATQASFSCCSASKKAANEACSPADE